jgi:hypothetical protein
MLYCAQVCVLLTCGAVVTLRAVEFAPLGGIKMPMCIGLGVAATATHRVQMLVGLRLHVLFGLMCICALYFRNAAAE